MAAGCKNTCLTEERLTNLIKSIFKKELEGEKWNILNMIRGNFHIQMRQIKELKTKFSYLKQSLELMEDILEEKENNLKPENVKFKTKI